MRAGKNEEHLPQNRRRRATNPKFFGVLLSAWRADTQITFGTIPWPPAGCPKYYLDLVTGHKTRGTFDSNRCRPESQRMIAVPRTVSIEQRVTSRSPVPSTFDHEQFVTMQKHQVQTLIQTETLSINTHEHSHGCTDQVQQSRGYRTGRAEVAMGTREVPNHVETAMTARSIVQHPAPAYSTVAARHDTTPCG